MFHIPGTSTSANQPVPEAPSLPTFAPISPGPASRIAPGPGDADSSPNLSVIPIAELHYHGLQASAFPVQCGLRTFPSSLTRCCRRRALFLILNTHTPNPVNPLPDSEPLHLPSPCPRRAWKAFTPACEKAYSLSSSTCSLNVISSEQPSLVIFIPIINFIIIVLIWLLDNGLSPSL